MFRSRSVVFMGLGVLLVGVALSGSMTWGQTSRKMMNLQGRLTDTEGSPTTGPHLFELRIYDAGPAGSGSQLYYEAQRVDVNKGIYNILVGDGYNSFTGSDPDSYAVAGGQTGGIPETVFNRDNLWLEIEIDEDNPLDPRTRVVSSAYAFNADTLDGKDSSAFAELGGDASFGDAQVNTLAFTGGGELDSGKVTALDALLTGGGLKNLASTGHGHADSNHETTWRGVARLQFLKEQANTKLRLRFAFWTYQDHHGFGGGGAYRCRMRFLVDGTEVYQSPDWSGGNSWHWRDFSYTTSAGQFAQGNRDIRVQYYQEDSFNGNGSFSNYSCRIYQNFAASTDTGILEVEETP